MECKSIITIGRQFGSGGREIGLKLAESFGIRFYDNELLDRAAKNSGICQELFENHDEKPTNSFLYSLVMDTYSMGFSSTSSYTNMPINHKIFLAQFNAIKEIANEGPCVMVGRCADYALDEYENKVSVFLYADMDSKVRRIAQKYQLTDAKAKDMIVKTDKQRASYYNYYTSKKWGDISSYDLCINTAMLGVEGTVDIIRDFVLKKDNG